ncbi:MAG: hypothetical protein B7Y40_08665 [Gammaproteobacteria bacterium 28-57-27]|nr:MAG: hypothetical protein B7Y40_08665 [Gammaproteobacteria bacterium 28-57-27]
MQKSSRWWLASVLVVLLLGGVLLLDFSSLRAPPAVFSGVVVHLSPSSSNCQPVVSAQAQAGCTLQNGTRAITLKMVGDVRPLRPFELRLILPETAHAQAVEASVDFVMVGMDMGINRYTLLKQADGNFVGKVILPVCSIGRSDWVAKLSVVVGLSGSGAQEMWMADVPFTAEASVGGHD